MGMHPFNAQHSVGKHINRVKKLGVILFSDLYFYCLPTCTLPAQDLSLHIWKMRKTQEYRYNKGRDEKIITLDKVYPVSAKTRRGKGNNSRAFSHSNT